MIGLAEGALPRKVTVDIRSRFGVASTPESFSVRISVDWDPQPRRNLAKS